MFLFLYPPPHFCREMLKYSYRMPLPDGLLGWQDVLTCPFCLDVAVDCVRLTHAERDRDCGVCACAACVKTWLAACTGLDLACPRCRYPICAAHLQDVIGQPNPADPLVVRLLADVPVECMHCKFIGSVATMSSHGAVCVVRHIQTLIALDGVLITEQHSFEDDTKAWVEAFLALYKLDATRACGYLSEWIASWEQPRDQLLFYGPFRLLFVTLPAVVFTTCETVWTRNLPVTVICSLFDLLTTQTPMGDPQDAVQRTLLDRLSHYFLSDNPDLLMDLSVSLSWNIAKKLPMSVFQTFTERLASPSIVPSTAHAAVLIRCVKDGVVEPSQLISRVLLSSNLEAWWSDAQVAHCIRQGIDSGSALHPLLPPLVDEWTVRCSSGKALANVAPIDEVIACLVADTYDFNDFGRAHALFAAMATSRASIATEMFRAPMYFWNAFEHVMSGSDTQPLMLTPRIALSLVSCATTQAGERDPLVRKLEEMLLNPDAFKNIQIHIPSDLVLPWTAFWLGHFTLADRLFPSNFDRVVWSCIPDDAAHSLIQSTMDHAVWWNDTSVSDIRGWSWARIVVRLLTIFAGRDGRLGVCQIAAHAVARHIGTTLNVVDVDHRNWTSQIPIFTQPCDLMRLLNLLDDTVLLQPNILPLLLRSHTNAIENRLRLVPATEWTAMATAIVVKHGRPRTVSAVAWSTWFRASMLWDAQSIAIAAVESMRGRPAGKRATWVTLLRIHAIVSSNQIAPRRCDAMIGLASKGASLSDVERVIAEWLMDPTPRLRSEANRWAIAARANQLVPFLLARIRRFCMHKIAMPFPRVGGSECIAGAVGEYLCRLATVDCAANACNALWFVIYYAADDLLLKVGQCWASNLRNRLLALCNATVDFMSAHCLWRLEMRCASFEPPVAALDSLCLGLHMVTRGNNANRTMDTLQTLPDARIDQLVSTLGGGDACHFLFVRTTLEHRWRVWAALVWHEARAWRHFVHNTIEGQESAKRVFRFFTVMPCFDPERLAWRETRAAMPLFALNNPH